jgi:uncharacterized protein YdeI (BOF family)
MRYPISGSLAVLLLSACATQTGLETRAPVSSADNLPKALDNQMAAVKGQVVRHAGGNQYVVSDATGEMLIDIPPAALRGRSLPAGTDVEVRGVVNRRPGRERIEAASVDVLERSSAVGAGKRPPQEPSAR